MFLFFVRPCESNEEIVIRKTRVKIINYHLNCHQAEPLCRNFTAQWVVGGYNGAFSSFCDRNVYATLRKKRREKGVRAGAWYISQNN